MTYTLTPRPPLGRKLAAWSVHLFTMTGAVWGLLSIIAIQNNQWKLAFIWIAVAVLVDGLDGTLARLARVSEYAPGLDGAMLDNIIDYLNYVIVPALFLYEADLLPAGFALAAAMLIALASAYQFCQQDAKTEDHYFKGFPSYWNVLAIYLLILGLSPWINLGVVVLCCILVFVPVKYVYPSRTERRRRLNIILTYAWGLVGFAGLMQYPDVPMWTIYVSFLYVAYYVALSVEPMLAQRRARA